MEQDNEVSGNGNSYTTEFRQYDPRLGRWKSLDPLMHQFPWMSPYVAFDNNPIYYTDPLGLCTDCEEGGEDDVPEVNQGTLHEVTVSAKGLPTSQVNKNKARAIASGDPIYENYLGSQEAFFKAREMYKKGNITYSQYKNFYDQYGISNDYLLTKERQLGAYQKAIDKHSNDMATSSSTRFTMTALKVGAAVIFAPVAVEGLAVYGTSTLITYRIGTSVVNSSTNLAGQLVANGGMLNGSLNSGGGYSPFYMRAVLSGTSSVGINTMQEGVKKVLKE